jgi:hypothetical protein
MTFTRILRSVKPRAAVQNVLRQAEALSVELAA